MRRALDLKGEIASVNITICGLGFYRLFINGTEITKGLLAPYVSNPDDYLYYDRYEITSLLTSGKNAVGIILRNVMGGSFCRRSDVVRRIRIPELRLCLGEWKF